MGHEGTALALRTPQIDPRKVADAILDATTSPTRDVKVGLMSKINTTMAKVAPAFGEKLAAMQAHPQQYDQPPSRDPEGSLWRASGGGDIYGASTSTMTAPPAVLAIAYRRKATSCATCPSAHRALDLAGVEAPGVS